MDGHQKPFTHSAWILITLLVAGIAFLQVIPEPERDELGEDPAGFVIMRLQSQYMLGLATLTDQRREIATSASILDMGTVGQRQRYMAFMITLGEPEAAKKSALRMRVALEQVGRELSEQQTTTQEMIDILAAGGSLKSGHPTLSNQLGWFGTLLEADDSKLKEIESAAATKVLLVGLICLGIFLAGVVGFIGIIFFTIRACTGSMQSGMNPPSKHHGIYSEVFALWLVVFLALTMLAGNLGRTFAKDNATLAMAFILFAFFLSLSALYWARFRGVSMEQLKADIGWNTGSGFIKEIAHGVLGYAMMLPLLGIGMVLTMILMLLQQFFTGGSESDPFAGTGGGAHPIIVDIANGGWQLRILLFTLAAVAAPIVEETMFRGVLYRQLRTSSNLFDHAISIIGSVLIVSFLFAAIHPQGWIAIPALMGIAIGMNLMREWRGSILPSMVVHGLSNGLVISVMLIFLS
jgi:membrane protease YdiL (CAAX protease family)